MTDRVMTARTELNAIVPEVWSTKFYDTLLAELPFNSIINRDYEGDITALGDTVRISTVPEFSAAEEMEEDARADADAVTVSQQSLVINKIIYKDFILTKKAMLQSLPVMDKLRDLAIYAVQKRLQRIIVDDIAPSTSNPDHAIAFDSGTTLTLADLLEAKELLDAQNVPLSDRHMVMGTAQANDIFNITGFTSSDFITAGSPLTTGQLSTELLGFMPHMTTELGDQVILFHKSFYTMAAQKGIDVNIYDLGAEGKRATRVNVDTLAGFKQLDGKRVVTIG